VLKCEIKFPCRNFVWHWKNVHFVYMIAIDLKTATVYNGDAKNKLGIVFLFCTT
jgi:hypothetical protein